MGGRREIRVLLDFGASGRHHSLYDELLGAPPGGVRYVVPSVPVSEFPGTAVRMYEKLRGALEGKLDLTALARRMNRARAGRYDVVHFANHIDCAAKPFVADFEQATSFLHAHTTAKTVKADFARVRAHRTRMMESPACRFLLPWTHEGAKSLWQAFPSKTIREKTCVVHLAMRVPESHLPLRHDNFRVLFLGTPNLKGDWNFYYRGGRTMLRVFERFARGKEDAELVITGEVPAEEGARVARLGAKCRVAGLLAKEEFVHTLRTSDALLYPAYSTPGLAFLEAMRYHVPIVTSDAWANREIVEDGANGFVAEFSKIETRGAFNLPPMKEEFVAFEHACIDSGLEQGLLEGLEKLYDSGRLRRRMGNAGFRSVRDGRFSIRKRNVRLRRIYEDCLDGRGEQ